MSAGERVRFHRDMKLVVDGENTERDWIFPNALRGKKRYLSTQRTSRIRRSAMGFLWLRKLCDFVTEMSRHTSAAAANK